MSLIELDLRLEEIHTAITQAMMQHGMDSGKRQEELIDVAEAGMHKLRQDVNALILEAKGAQRN